MIINIYPQTFGGALRNGDLVAVGNVVEYLRKTTSPDIKFYFYPGAVQSNDYCQKFFTFLTQNTDYFSLEEGSTALTWENINLWDFRSISGDLVKINNNRISEKKIVIFPLFNASYNVYRNWPIELFNKILSEYSQAKYASYKKIICTEDTLQIDGMDVSTDFLTNLEHIMTSEIFVGGDTGTSHFVGALDRGPSDITYHYSGRGLLHTTPINALNGKGRVAFYWKDPQSSKWL